MATSEQEQKKLLPETFPTTEHPTQAFESKLGDASATSPDVPVQDSLVDSFDVLPPGKMLGQYRIVDRLGAGGMGQVYKAVHPVMERVVALKIISPRLMQEASARARFQREVRHAARLIHPNIVVAYDAAEVEGLCFLVMEFINGQDIAQLLMRYGRPPAGLACEIIRQAAVGLQYAHDHGMVHRDIKPANLVVASARPLPPPSPPVPGGEGGGIQGWPDAPLVKILDFGLARLSVVEGTSSGRGETLTREGYIVGTPEFMSPEQARDSRLVDIRSDIYSLGCTLYMLLAGRPPFKAASSFEMAVMHLSQPPEPVARFNPALPLELSALVHRMLAKKPEDRFQTPGAVAAALQPWARLPAAAAVPGSAPTPMPVPAPLSQMPPASGAHSSMIPPASSSLSASQLPAPARPSVEQPAMPPSVWMMHLQVLMRTFILVIIFAAIFIGCFMYLPGIGENLQQLWHRVTQQTNKTIQSQ